MVVQIKRVFRRLLVGVGVAVVCVAGVGSAAAHGTGAVVAPVVHAAFGARYAELPAGAARVADWVSASHDNRDLPFMIVDKTGARLFLFDGNGSLRATTPVLLGLARGDDSPPGIGMRKLSAIRPEERITPAGRFVAEAGKNLAGQDILWIDYDAGIALHRASDRKPGATAKSRAERLSSTTPADMRVSLGCINVSTAFYDTFIRPTFSRTKGITYIMPETRSLSAEFDMPDVGAATQIAAGF